MTQSAVRSTETSSLGHRARPVKMIVAIAAAALVVIGVGVGFLVENLSSPSYPIHPTKFVRYFGLHEPDAPNSYSGIDQFAQSAGRQPNIVSYYSPWLESFQAGFASSAEEHGAITLVQIDPQNVSLKSIANGKYNSYLQSYAMAVRNFDSPVVLSFGHEMNGNWSSWGFQHTPPAVFVAAWQHIVKAFRSAGANNVIWLWTVNVVDAKPLIPDPSPWWPGRQYVTWIGIDGYFYLHAQTFSQVFGPTIVDVRMLSSDPILIAETGAEQSAGQASKIDALFAGARQYGLSGFVWFDENVQGRSWRIDDPEVFAALHRDSEAFMKAPSAQASPSADNPAP